MPKINVILFEPEIAENTGNIARTCVGFDVVLHLIRPYGFFLNDKKIVRSAANYWQFLEYHEYDCFEDFINTCCPEQIFIYTRYGKNKPDAYNYCNNKDVYLMFGKESTGIPKEILEQYMDTLIRIPTTKNIRSLNLSNTVAIAVYEVIKQCGYPHLETLEPHKKGYL